MICTRLFLSIRLPPTVQRPLPLSKATRLSIGSKGIRNRVERCLVTSNSANEKVDPGFAACFQSLQTGSKRGPDRHAYLHARPDTSATQRRIGSYAGAEQRRGPCKVEICRDALQEARRLMLTENLHAGEAGFQVGYEDQSEFNREYKRHFGVPPIRDIRGLREVAT
jgi:hypothetical protein